LPTSPHEAACASGSVAILAAAAEIEAGRYDLAAVIGVEQMQTVDPAAGGNFLGTAAWYEREGKGIDFPFPKLFGKLGDEYDKRLDCATSIWRVSRRLTIPMPGVIPSADSQLVHGPQPRVPRGQVQHGYWRTNQNVGLFASHGRRSRDLFGLKEIRG
jgi:hypothetical protein